MVKARKGLLLSLFTLIVAIAVTTTSTYAWFVMNSQVTAQNMQITASANSKYLVIEATPSGTGANAGKIGDIDARTLDASTTGVGDNSLLPVKYNTLSEGTPTWQTATGTSRTDGTKTGEYANVASADVIHYVKKFSFVIGIAPNSPVAATNLKISELRITTSSGDANSVFYDAVSVLVVAKNGTSGTPVADSYVDAGHNATAGALAGSNTVLAGTVATDGTPVYVDVYVYINGDNANITTQNATSVNLGSYGVAIDFVVD